VPFPSREAALHFFGGDTLWADAWVEGLEPTSDGLRPRFDIDVMVASLEEACTVECWDAWRRVVCPTLVVRAEGGIDGRLAGRMIEALPQARLAEIDGASHDVHLERPERWRQALQSFLAESVRR
jgi:pimeloyl-ACP methyl ester carboxylesterase